MRRASSKLLSHLPQYPKSSSSLLSADFISQISSLTTAATEPHHRKTCTKSNGGLLFSKIDHNQIQKTPSQNLNTLVDQQMSRRQTKTKQKSQLEEAFESAKTTDDMLKAFKDMEASFNELELGMACLKLGLKLDQEGEDPEKVFTFATRALKVLDTDDKMSLPLAMALQLLGSSCYSLNKFNDSLGYLNRANRILCKFEEQGSYNPNDVRPILHAVQLELANTKTAMGRREEAIGNLKRCLEIKEMMFEKDSLEIGTANRGLAEALVAILNFNEALPYCLKAVEIHKAQLGQNSVEVAHDRRLLGVIYTGLELHEKALEQNQLSQKVLKNWGLDSDLLRAEIDAANMKIALGKYDEAINTLKGVVQNTAKDGEDRALVFISMSKALSNQENFSDSKRCLDIACGILDKKEKTSPLIVSECYMEISMQYETMNEFEKAISLLKRTQFMLEKLPEEQHSVGSVSARIGWLLLLTGKVAQSIPYLEEAAERLKESFGTKHYGVGYVYNNLGAAYLELDRPQSAAQVFAVAKEIMDVSLGPHHTDSIEACQNLSKAYSSMGSYPLAINFQEKVVEAWESHGPTAADELKEAYRVLDQLKKQARSGAAVDSTAPTKALPLPQEKVVEAWESHGPTDTDDELEEAYRVLDQLKKQIESGAPEDSTAPTKALPLPKSSRNSPSGDSVNGKPQT